MTHVNTVAFDIHATELYFKGEPLADITRLLGDDPNIVRSGKSQMCTLTDAIKLMQDHLKKLASEQASPQKGGGPPRPPSPPEPPVADQSPEERFDALVNQLKAAPHKKCGGDIAELLGFARGNPGRSLASVRADTCQKYSLAEAIAILEKALLEKPAGGDAAAAADPDEGAVDVEDEEPEHEESPEELMQEHLKKFGHEHTPQQAESELQRPPNLAGRLPTLSVESDSQQFEMTPFTTVYSQLHTPPTAVRNHSFCWFPSRPVVGQPLLLWCDASCCRLGAGKPRQTVQKAEYFQIPQPANPDDSRAEAVVMRFTNPPVEGLTKVASAFSNLYQREYLLSSEAYSFNNTPPIAFIATRRHTWDLAKELEADKTVALALADDTDEARIRAVELRRLVRVRQLLHEVDTMHESLLHGDIKPVNVALAKAAGNEPKRMQLINFEFAPADAAATDEGMSVSNHTAFWMSPSQAIKLPKSRADDLFSVALVLYEIMAAPMSKEEAAAEKLFDATCPDAPRFWQHWAAEEQERRPLTLSHAVAQLKLADIDDDGTRVFRVPPIPKCCHALVVPLVEKLLKAWAAGKTKELRQAPHEQPAVSQPVQRSVGDRFAFRTELLTAEVGSLCLMLVRLQQQLRNAQGHPHLEKLNDKLLTSKHAYFKKLPPALVTMIRECRLAHRANTLFIPMDQLPLLSALRELRNAIANTPLSPADCLGSIMWHCPLIVAHLQQHLDEVAAEATVEGAEIVAVDGSLSILVYGTGASVNTKPLAMPAAANAAAAADREETADALSVHDPTPVAALQHEATGEDGLPNREAVWASIEQAAEAFFDGLPGAIERHRASTESTGVDVPVLVDFGQIDGAGESFSGLRGTLSEWRTFTVSPTEAADLRPYVVQADIDFIATSATSLISETGSRDANFGVPSLRCADLQMCPPTNIQLIDVGLAVACSFLPEGRETARLAHISAEQGESDPADNPYVFCVIRLRLCAALNDGTPWSCTVVLRMRPRLRGARTAEECPWRLAEKTAEGEN